MKAESNEVVVVLVMSVKSGIAQQIGNKYQIVSKLAANTAVKPGQASQDWGEVSWATNQM